MEVSIKSRNIELTPELKSYIERKLGRFERKLENIMEIKIEVFEEHTRSALDRQVVTVSLSGANVALRAEERADTIMNAVDKAAESVHQADRKTEGQVAGQGQGRPLHTTGRRRAAGCTRRPHRLHPQHGCQAHVNG